MALDLKYHNHHNHINQEYGDKTRLEKDHVSNEKPVIADDQRFYKPALFDGEAADMDEEMMEECLWLASSK